MFSFRHKYSLDSRGFQLSGWGITTWWEGFVWEYSPVDMVVWSFETSGWICKGNEYPQVYLNSVHRSSVKIKQLADIWQSRSCKKSSGTVCAYSYKEKAQEHNYYLIMTIEKLKLNFTVHHVELCFAKPILCEHLFLNSCQCDLKIIGIVDFESK